MKEGDESIVNALLYSDVLEIQDAEICVALFDP